MLILTELLPEIIHHLGLKHIYLFIVFTIVVIAIILYVVFKKKITNKLFIASAILLIGGGIGNLIDRIF